MASYTIVPELLGLFALIGLNGFFSMAEFALVSSRTFRLSYLSEQGIHGADTALDLLKEPNTFLSTIQIAITLIGIGAGAYSGATFSKYIIPYLKAIPLVSPYAQTISILLIVIAITYLTLLFGELLPKRLGMQDPERLACRCAGTIRGLSKIFTPVVWLMSASTGAMLRVVGSDTEPVFRVTEEEIKLLVEEGARAGVVQAMEQQMVESIFRLGDRKVFSVMTPRPEIIALDITKDASENIAKILESQHSRFPVFRDQLDSIIGIARARDIWKLWAADGAVPDLMEVVKEAPVIPENFPVFRMLELLRQAGSPMAIAMDEYGAVSGLVTLYDVFEAIVGDFSSLNPMRDKPLVEREDGSILVDGLYPIEDVREKLKLKEIPGEEKGYFHTLSGFMMMILGKIPDTGDVFEWRGFRFEVVDMDGQRVDRVLITPVEPVADSMKD